ncbi:MAG: DNA polymerase sliding clamp [Sulfolobaceae archaeon]
MFKIIYRNAKEFVQFLSAVGKISDNITINLTEEGMISRHLTEDNSMMSVINISKEVFDEYVIEKPVSINMDIASLKKVLRKVTGKKSTIEISESEVGIRVTLRDMSTGIKSTTYVKTEKSYNLQVLKEPNVSLSVSFTLEGKIFKHIVDEASLIGDQLNFKAEKDYIEIYSEGTGKLYKATLRSEKPLKELRIDSETEAAYNMEHMKDVAKAIGSMKIITIEFGKNTPIKIYSKGETGGYIGFWVAPRIL